jgi:nascent polypeptide-associated complex subunit beta
VDVYHFTVSTNHKRAFFLMNPEKLKELQSQVRIGGKGSVRRKVKKVHRTVQDDKKLQQAIKKLNVQPLANILEVNFFKADGTVLHFVAPKGILA